MSAPTWETILGAMLAALEPLAIPTAGSATQSRYLRKLDRYLGELDIDEAGVAAGIAGRTPAVLCDFAGEKAERVSVGRRIQRVTGTFLAICAVDSHRSREDRDRLFAIMRDVRRLLVGSRLGLEMSRLRYEGILVVAERPQAFAYAVKVSTLYRVDWSIAPADETTLESISGDVTDASDPPNTIGSITVEEDPCER